MLKSLIIYIVSFCFLMNQVSAQIKSTPNNEERKSLIKSAIKAGFYMEKCDTFDLVCMDMNAQNKAAYEKIKHSDVSVVKMYSPIMKFNINTLDFYDDFNRYFKVDTNNFTLFLYMAENGKNNLFGTTQCEINKKKEVMCTPLFSAQMEDNSFINLLESGNSLLIFSMSFDATLFVVDNRINAIVNGEIVEGKKFFGKYSLDEINRRFRGASKFAPIK